MDRLARDPDYQRRRAEAEAKREEPVKANEAAERPILAALAETGEVVPSLYALSERGAPLPPAAVGVLAQWIEKAGTANVQAAIIGVLAVRKASAAAPALLTQFTDPTTGDSNRWAIGNALREIADDALFDDLVRLATDRRYGSAREMVVLALGQMRRNDPTDVLIRLLSDEDVAAQAAFALGRKGGAKEAAALEALLKHKKKLIRQTAAKSIRQIHKRLTKL